MSGVTASVRVRCLLPALVCVSGTFLWQAATVHYTYSGNWTALFCTGSLSAKAPAPVSGDLYVFRNSRGYDGQFYRYIAHDPLFRRGFDGSIDAPRIRYRRILVPAMAALLAGSNDVVVDAAYIAVVLGSILVGAYWLSRLSVLWGCSPWLGVAFAAIPSVLVSIDRLTVDAALAACCVGFVLYSREWQPRKLYWVLVAAALTRETGLLPIGACVLWLIFERRLREAAVYATASLPALGWYIFVNRHTVPVAGGFLTPVLFSGIARPDLHPVLLNDIAAVRILALVLDSLALAGIAAALIWAWQRARQRALSTVTLAIYLFSLLAIVLAPGDPWSDVYSFGRTLTPLLLFCALDGLAEGSRWPAFAMFLADPRIGLQMGPQILKVLRGLA